MLKEVLVQGNNLRLSEAKHLYWDGIRKVKNFHFRREGWTEDSSIYFDITGLARNVINDELFCLSLQSATADDWIVCIIEDIEEEDNKYSILGLKLSTFILNMIAGNDLTLEEAEEIIRDVACELLEFKFPQATVEKNGKTKLSEFLN